MKISALCWLPGQVEGNVTAEKLSHILRAYQHDKREPDLRCEISAGDEFTLRLMFPDEGFESDEDASLASDQTTDEETASTRLQADSSRLQKITEECSSSSANSSCSENDEMCASRLSTQPTTAPNLSCSKWRTIDIGNVIFCHTDDDTPESVAFVVRKWSDIDGDKTAASGDRANSALQTLVIRCASRTLAKSVTSSYHEITRRLRLERSNNARRRMEIGRCSFRTRPDSAGNRYNVSGDTELSSTALYRPSSKLSQRFYSSVALRSFRPTESSKESKPMLSERTFTKIEAANAALHKQTPSVQDVVDKAERDVANPSEPTETAQFTAVVSTPLAEPIASETTDDTSPVDITSIAPTAPPRRYQKQRKSSVTLVPTKSGLTPYRVITAADVPRPATMVVPPSWPQMSQFDARSSCALWTCDRQRRPLVWMTPSVASATLAVDSRLTKTDIASGYVWERQAKKTPATRSKAQELGDTLSQVLRELRGAVNIQLLKRVDTTTINQSAVSSRNRPQKSVMKKSAKRSSDRGSAVEVKHVTFSAFSTVQVLD